MCLFCTLSTPVYTSSSSVEVASPVETIFWVVGGCIFLFVLYEGYKNKKQSDYMRNLK